MIFGEMLQTWRLQEGYSVREAAKLVELSPATFNRIERGEKADWPTVKKLLEFFF